jgi:hypothetical protein
MSNEHRPDHGKLFENKDKKKPSQPDMLGECSLGGVAFEIRGWKRGDDELEVALAPPRGDRNTYPPDVFKGTFQAVPQKTAKQRAKETVQAPLWKGELESDDAAYNVLAFEKQGKSGPYLTLTFEKTEKTARPTPEWVNPDDDTNYAE